MDRGTYVSASGGVLQFQRLDIVNNNLANVNTPGFKKQFIVSSTRSFSDTLASQMALGDVYSPGDHDRSPDVKEFGTYTDFSMGPIKDTGNPFDVALTNPNDFFVVETPNGTQYTRAGNFTLNEEGALATSDGCVVQGDGGALTATGGRAEITPGGTLLVDGTDVGTLKVVRFEDPSVLEHAGQNRFVLKEGNSEGETVEPDVVPQALEMSNVSAISSMIDLITTQRGFQLYEKTAKTIDEMNGTAVQQIGKVQG